MRYCATVLMAALSLQIGCGDSAEEPIVVKPGGAKKGPAAAAPAATAEALAEVPKDLPPLPVREFRERDFVETDYSRDPFRGFESVFTASDVRIEIQRDVVVSDYALDELKLVGIVSRGVPRILVNDPIGIGHVARVGDFIGRAEVVNAVGSSRSELRLNWRVDRIRQNDVVFIREDPSHPEIPTSTRIKSLRDPNELSLDIVSGSGRRNVEVSDGYEGRDQGS